MLRRGFLLFAGLAACTTSGSGEDAPDCLDDTAETTINSAAVEGRYLHLDVGYGGGCEDHEFTLVWSGSVGASSPPVVQVTLKHDGHDDRCEAWVTQDLYFDLSSLDATLAEGGGDPATLVLEGSSFAMTYTPGQPDAPPDASVQLLQRDCDDGSPP